MRLPRDDDEGVKNRLRQVERKSTNFCISTSKKYTQFTFLQNMSTGLASVHDAIKSVVPPHYLERASSQARIRSALVFAARLSSGGSGSATEPISISEEAVALIDDFLAHVVEDTVTAAAAAARLRVGAPAGGPPIRPLLSGAGGGHAPVLAASDVDVVLSEVWPSLVLPASDLTSRVPPSKTETSASTGPAHGAASAPAVSAPVAATSSSKADAAAVASTAPPPPAKRPKKTKA